jgi:UDP-GlcNAc:undecaprenyl-phosphate GlcNAc-1-phosphate transferase
MNSIIYFIFTNLIILIFLFKYKINILLDKPDNFRKLHKKNTPLVGGIIIIINIVILNIIYFTELNNLYFAETFFRSYKDAISFFIITYSIFFTGLIDDKVKINANIKFIILLILILIALIIDNDLIIRNIRISFYNKNIPLENFSIPFSILCYLLFINAFNMFDGINLQSGFYSIIVFVYLLIILNNSNYILYAFLISITIFLILNAQGKIFLGDNGSLTIPYIISYFLVKSYNNNIIEFSDDIFIVMMIPGFELFRLFFTRIINKKNPFTADRKHIHHILLKKNGYKKTITTLVVLIMIPFLLQITNLNNLVIIIISLTLYISVLYESKRQIE